VGKVTIYLPDSLEERVRGHSISMSPVCQKALEEDVRKVEAKAKATNDIVGVAERLRATRDEAEQEEYQRGRELGVEWARESATLGELENMEELSRTNWVSWEIGENTLTGYLEKEWNVSRIVRVKRSPFMNGLINGALDVLREVNPHL